MGCNKPAFNLELLALHLLRQPCALHCLLHNYETSPQRENDLSGKSYCDFADANDNNKW